MTASRIRAGPSGCVRPCSQFLTVAGVNPNRAANWDWLRPSFRRKDRTSIKGGLASGKTHQENKVARMLGVEPMPAFPAEVLERSNCSGGSHDCDWRCPNQDCRHFNSIKRRACAACGEIPDNGRMTRKALRERAAEHRIVAILGKHGLSGEGYRLGESSRSNHRELPAFAPDARCNRSSRRPTALIRCGPGTGCGHAHSAP
jgi:hypothetical protein